MPLKSATCGRELEAGLRRRPGSNNVTFDGKPLDGVFVMHRRQRKTRWLGAFVFSSQEDQATCGAAYVRVSTNWRGESADLDAILALSSKWSDNSSVKIMQMTRSAGHHCSCGSCHIAGISSNEGLSSEPRQGT